MAETTKVTLIGPAKIGGKSYAAGKSVSVTDTEIEHLVEAGALPTVKWATATSANDRQDPGVALAEGLLQGMWDRREQEIAELHDQLALLRETTDKEIAEIRTAADQRIADAETAAAEQIKEAQASANDQLAAYRKEADAKVAAIQAELDALKTDKAKPAK
ncbi:hypothetical protein [Rhizobium sp. 11_C7_N12_5]|uniref:hypothetical protein n=1 Tax=Rhizobium sp. 11_C7_N12_5 TaxID=3240770 RepID=UPI003F1E61C4